MHQLPTVSSRANPCRLLCYVFGFQIAVHAADLQEFAYHSSELDFLQLFVVTDHVFVYRFQLGDHEALDLQPLRHSATV